MWIPPWPGAMPAPRCRSRSCALTTVWSLVPHVTSTLNAGLGPRFIRPTVETFPMRARSATPGWPARPFAPRANTEAKFLMLRHAFEGWSVLRVCLHADVRNQRSRAAIERIGGQFEGILRAHRMAADFIPRDSARYSIVAAEWPEVRQRLLRARGSRLAIGQNSKSYTVDCAKNSAISRISSPVSRRSPARMTPSACRALRAPTIAPVTAGLCNVQAMATSPCRPSMHSGDLLQAIDQRQIPRDDSAP